MLASSGNTNVTRSLLYSFEPVTHTGVRLTFAANDQVNLTIGANNGFVTSDEDLRAQRDDAGSRHRLDAEQDLLVDAGPLLRPRH